MTEGGVPRIGRPDYRHGRKEKGAFWQFLPRWSAIFDRSLQTFDHDFLSAADGLINPHGLYDCKRNRGHITLGFSPDTSQFARDSFLLWWRRYGAATQPI